MADALDVEESLVDLRKRHDDFSSEEGKQIRDAVIALAIGYEYESSSDEEEDYGENITLHSCWKI